MTDVRPKLIYRAERHPRFDQAGFTERWRRHGRLGMSQARWARNIARYRHCDPIEPARAPRDCAGIALLWYKSEAARLNHVADESARAVMRPDELDTFARPVKEFSALLDEAVLAPAPALEGSAAAFVFLRAGAVPVAGGRIALGDWASARRTALAALPGFRGYTLNLPRGDSAALGFGLTFNAIEEIAFAAPVDLPAPSPFDAAETIWTRIVELYAIDPS